MPPKSDGILESSLYVSNMARSVRFYEQTFGFRVVKEFGERGCAMHAGTRQVLLLFKKGGSRTIQSPHDGEGELHIAFAIPADQLASWESWLQTRGIAVEEKKQWELGGWSLYFRDPDRHLVEVVTPGVWPVYCNLINGTGASAERLRQAIVIDRSARSNGSLPFIALRCGGFNLQVLLF